MLTVGASALSWSQDKNLKEMNHSYTKDKKDYPLVSFMVTAWNAEQHVPGFLASYKKLDYPNKELFLCLGGEDEGLGLAEEMATPTINVFRRYAEDTEQQALGYCLARSKGEIIYLMSVESRPDNKTVAAVLNRIFDKNAETVSGTARPLETDNLLAQSFWAAEQANLRQNNSVLPQLSRHNTALTREALVKAGSFNVVTKLSPEDNMLRQLQQKNTDIHYLPSSAMPTAFPEHFSAFVNRQAERIAERFKGGMHYKRRADILHGISVLMLPFILIALFVLGLWQPFLAVIPLLVLGYSLWERLRFQKQAGLKTSLKGGLQHVAAEQIAAVKASWYLLINRHQDLRHS